MASEKFVVHETSVTPGPRFRTNPLVRPLLCPDPLRSAVPPLMRMEWVVSVGKEPSEGEITSRKRLPLDRPVTRVAVEVELVKDWTVPFPVQEPPEVNMLLPPELML